MPRDHGANPIKPGSIQVINLFKDAVFQTKPIDLPAALVGCSVRIVVEVFVFGFEEAEIGAVQFEIRPGIYAEQDPVLMLREKPPRRIRLASKFRYPCTEIDEQVWAIVQKLIDPSQVLGVAGNMRADERGVWVPLHQTRKAIHDIHEGRKACCRKMPVRMGVKFFPTFVAVIQRIEEGDGIGDMDEDRNAKFACRVP